MADRAEQLTLPPAPRGMDGDGPDGALAIGPAGRILAVNAAAAAALGLDGADAVGLTLADLGRRTGDRAFFEHLATMIDGPGSLATALTYRGRSRIASFTLAVVPLAGLGLGPPEEPRWVVVLRPAPAGAAAPRPHPSERPMMRTVQRYRAAAIAAALIVGVAAVVLVRPAADADPSERTRRASAAPRTVTVEPRPLVSRLTVVGTIEPGSTLNVVAPFDGIVTEMQVEYGSRVTRGDVLLVLDTFELAMRIREAQAAVLKAAQRVADLKSWGNSPDVARARRGVATAELALEDTQRRLQETKVLLDRGIVPRNEYDGLQQQVRTEAMALAAAKQDLDAALERASPANRRIADLELENAQGKLDDLTAQRAGAVVRAPVAGVVLRPPAARATGPGQAPPDAIAVGFRATRGQTLFGIADLETLAVTAKVDEIDVNRVRVGQPVTITGEAFDGEEIAGRIAHVAAQASTREGGGRVAEFDVTVRLSALTEAQRRRVRVGMSTHLSIEVYANAAAIVVPPDAVRGSTAAPVVQVRDPATGTVRDVPVAIGETTETGVEIRAGLAPGAVVVLP